MGLGDGSGVDGLLFSGRSSGRRWRPAVLLALAASLWAGLNLSASASAWVAWDADPQAIEDGWDRGPRLPERFTMVFGGDVLVHTGVWSQAAAYARAGERFDFRPMFAPLRTLLTVADVAICHLETPVSPNDTNLSSFPVFNVPHEIVDAIAWSGYDGCSTASNHSLDQGIAGIRATIDALEDAGLRHAGTAANRRASPSLAASSSSVSGGVSRASKTSAIAHSSRARSRQNAGRRTRAAPTNSGRSRPRTLSVWLRDGWART